jgi:hypothetical protein
MSSGTLDAALPKPGPFQAFTGKLGSLFSQLPFGWHKWPQAAQRIATIIVEQARFCPLLPTGLHDAFVLSDPKIMKLLSKLAEADDREGDGNTRFKVGRRCIQKGLKQLEDIGVIRRFRKGGVRFIQFIAALARPNSKADRKAGGAQKPAVPARRDSAAAARSRTSDPAAEKPPDPVPDSGPVLSTAEISAGIRAIIGGTEPISEPAAAAPGPEASPGTDSTPRLTEAIPGRRGGPSLAAAVPVLTREDRARQEEEARRRSQEYFAAKRRAGTFVSGQEHPAAPPAPSGADEITRE